METENDVLIIQMFENITHIGDDVLIKRQFDQISLFQMKNSIYKEKT